MITFIGMVIAMPSTQFEALKYLAVKVDHGSP